MPIDPILWQRIKEMAAKYVVQEPLHEIGAKIETPKPPAPIPHGSLQAELASAFTKTLAFVFGVRQLPTLLNELQFPVKNRHMDLSMKTRCVVLSSLRCKRSDNTSLECSIDHFGICICVRRHRLELRTIYQKFNYCIVFQTLYRQAKSAFATETAWRAIASQE